MFSNNPKVNINIDNNMKIKRLTEIFVIFVLFVAFFMTFGYSSLKRYMAEKVIADESKTISSDFPSLTICLV